MRRSARSSSGTAVSGPGSCWRGWRRRSWPGRIVWSGWTGSERTGPLLAPVPGLSSTTAAGLARRVTAGQWRAVETGLAAVAERMLELLPALRAAALAEGPVTIDLDATDVEVYGSKKRGVAYNHLGQRVGRPHVASWAETELVLAADLGSGTDDPRASAPDLLRRALAGLPARARAGAQLLRSGHIRYRIRRRPKSVQAGQVPP